MLSKGVQTLVSVLVLIAIVAAVCALIYSWLTGYVSGTTSEVEATARLGRIKVVGVTYSTSKVIAYVQNVGEVPVRVVSAYVMFYLNRTVVDDCVNRSVNVVLRGLGDADRAVVTCSLARNTTYVVRVVTDRGVSSDYVFTTVR